MYGPTMFQYALIPANVGTSYGLNTSTARCLVDGLGKSKLWNKIKTENIKLKLNLEREWLHELWQVTIIEEGNFDEKSLVL
jgi:hypothetical protein